MNRYTCLNPGACDCGRLDTGQFCRHWGDTEPPRGPQPLTAREADLAQAADQQTVQKAVRDIHAALHLLTDISFGRTPDNSEIHEVTLKAYAALRVLTSPGGP